MNSSFDTWIIISTLPVFILLSQFTTRPDAIKTTQDGAVLAINSISEWSKWMAGIQTAGIAALAYLVFEKDSTQIRATGEFARCAAFVGFLYSGAALFCSAWVLSALPSHALSIYRTDDQSDSRFDIYAQPLFRWWKQPTLAYLLFIKHWLWAIGLMDIGSFTLTLFMYPTPQASPTQPQLLNCAEQPVEIENSTSHINAIRMLRCIPAPANPKK